jgi:endo-1,4-beta-D-glucanase Y
VTRPDGQYQTAKALFNRAYEYVIQTFKDNGATNVAFQVVVNNNNGRGEYLLLAGLTALLADRNAHTLRCQHNYSVLTQVFTYCLLIHLVCCR